MNFALSTVLSNPQHLRTLSESEVESNSYVHTRVINSQRLKAKLSRSDRAESRLRTKAHLTALAKEIHEFELSDRIERCHSKLSVLTCGRHVCQIIPNSVCEFRLCPDCARRRSRKLLKKYLPMIEPFVQKFSVKPMHLVLTQKHRIETLKESVERLMSSFRKLIRRSFWAKYFKGGFWVIEFTIDKDGLYHTHLHILVFRTKFCDVNELRAQWRETTGDSHVLRLDKITDTLAGAREVLKYAVKPLSVAKMTAKNLRDFVEMKNTRLVGTFGEFRKFCAEYIPSDNAVISDQIDNSNLSEGCACPQCDAPLFELRMSASDLPNFLRDSETSLTKKIPPS